jgi:hypothetical protein
MCLLMTQISQALCLLVRLISQYPADRCRAIAVLLYANLIRETTLLPSGAELKGMQIQS